MREEGREVENGLKTVCFDQQAEPGNGERANIERRAGHHGEEADILRCQAPAGIEAVTHRAPRQQRHAQRVGQGIGRERGKGRLLVGQRLACITQRQRVVA